MKDIDMSAWHEKLTEGYVLIRGADFPSKIAICAPENIRVEQSGYVELRDVYVWAGKGRLYEKVESNLERLTLFYSKVETP